MKLFLKENGFDKGSKFWVKYYPQKCIDISNLDNSDPNTTAEMSMLASVPHNQSLDQSKNRMLRQQNQSFSEVRNSRNLTTNRP